MSLNLDETWEFRLAVAIAKNNSLLLKGCTTGLENRNSGAELESLRLALTLAICSAMLWF